MGFPLHHHRHVAAAAFPLVRAHAQPGRARHPLPPHPHRSLLGSIHPCRVRAHLPAHRLRRLLPRAQIQSSQPDLRPLDARPGRNVRRERRARRDTPGAVIALVRRLGKNWWLWGAAVSILFLAFVDLIAPVYIFPLFNKYTKLQDAHIKDPILSMARANGIPATEVYEFDASRQSNRVSANVSGFAGTTRISLNDNLLKRCTLP